MLSGHADEDPSGAASTFPVRRSVLHPPMFQLPMGSMILSMPRSHAENIAQAMPAKVSNCGLGYDAEDDFINQLPLPSAQDF